MHHRPASAAPAVAPAIASRPGRAALPHLLLALLGLLCASEAAAQFTQYAAPGTGGATVRSQRQRLEEGSANARWRLGRLRLDPQLAVREVGYLSNVFGASDSEEEVSDYRALVAAGVNAYLPIRSKGMLSAFVTPEYSWWAELDALRGLNLSSGAGLFGFFNRLTLSVDGRRIDRERLLSVELPTVVQVEEERLSLAFELQLRRSLFAFAEVRASRYRHSGAAERAIDGLELSPLDRDYDGRRVGVRLRLPGNWRLGLGLEDVENEFARDPGLRSNSGTNPFLELGFEGGRLSAQLNLSDTALDFPEGSALNDFRAATGNGRIAWRRPKGFSTVLYASRNVVFSALRDDSLFADRRLGIRLEREPGPRLLWTIFVEQGDLDFSGPPPERRRDDLTSYGADLGIEITDSLRLVATITRSEYRSQLPDRDRSTGSLGLRLSLRRDLFPF